MRSLALALAVTFPLLAAGGAANPPAEPPAPKPVKLAAPGFTAVNVDDKVATFFSDHFAQQLALAGLSVISASEIQALIGFERSKQLMGCSESSQSCMAELGDALGVDGVVTGSIGKFGATFQANIKVLQAGSAQALSIISRKASSDEDLLNVLTDAARQAASDVLKKLGRSAGQGAKSGYIEENGHKYRVSDPSDREPPRHTPDLAQPPQQVGLRYHHTFTFELAPSSYAAYSQVWNGAMIAVQYEAIFTPALGAFLGLFLGVGVDTADTGPDPLGVGVGGLRFGARWYVSGTAPAGFWLSPGGNLFVTDGDPWRGSGLAPDLSAGYSFLLGWMPVSFGARVQAYWLQDSIMWVPGLVLNLGFAL